MASTAMSTVPKAVMIITRVSGERSLMAFNTWSPSMPGIFMSVMTRAGVSSANNRSPSSPLAAATTW